MPLCRGTGGAEGNRTPDLDIANVALSQLSYGPLIGEPADNVGMPATLSRIGRLGTAPDVARERCSCQRCARTLVSGLGPNQTFAERQCNRCCC